MHTDDAIGFVISHTYKFADRTPTLGTLLEEIAEYARALENKHTDAPALELIQIGSIAINLLRRYSYDEAYAALTARYGPQS